MAIRLQGFEEYIRKLKDAPVKLAQMIDEEMEDAARDWANKAVQSAPYDEGFLRGGIDALKVGNHWEVISRMAYSAYMEWGTGTLVSVPAELSDYAQTFKGSTGGAGTFQQLLKNITEWVRRKGIGDDSSNVAFLIALKIVRVGVKPQPFFFIHKVAVEQELIGRLRNRLKQFK